MPKEQLFMCRVHGATPNTYQIILRNKEQEVVFQHVYCIQCYDRFLQNNLDLLNPVKEEDEQKEGFRL